MPVHSDQSIVSVFNFINKHTHTHSLCVCSGYFECGTNSLVEIRILKAELSAHLNSSVCSSFYKLCHAVMRKFVFIVSKKLYIASLFIFFSI